MAFTVGATAWLAAWGWLVRRRTSPLWVDTQASAALAAGKQIQDEGIRLLIVEGPAGAVVAAVGLSLVALGFRSTRGAVAVLAGVALEVTSVQWVIKPLVHRHELAPGYSFPSSHVGAVVAVAASASLLVSQRGPVGRSLQPGLGRLVRWLVGAAGVGDAALVAAATITTGGHLFSDVVAVIPWAVAVPWLTFALVVPPVAEPGGPERRRPRTHARRFPARSGRRQGLLGSPRRATPPRNRSAQARRSISVR